jgi:uncharacterized membrane protein
MPQTTKFWNDRKMSDIIGTLLRAGVLSAASVVLLGGILFFIQHPGELFEFGTFRGEPTRLRKINIILQEALSFRSRALIQLGLLLLIATPVARVLFSLIGFIFEKDWIYIIITFIVLIILFASLFSNYLNF